MKTKSKGLLRQVLIIVLGVFAAGGLYYKYKSDVQLLKTTYRDEQSAKLKEVTNQVGEKLRYIYQTIRTMSFVPGVRKIDRYATNFDRDAKATVQQLFNNAYLNIKLSEIYLLPESLDPDKIDEKTKKPQEPITTFDEFIPSGFAIEKKDEPPPENEVEIFEYRLMKNQLEFFAKSFPTVETFKELNLPIVSGPEVVTCDNAEFKGNDSDRSGLVFTVPFYNMNGKFQGAVSAVLRSNVLRGLLPSNDYTVVNATHNYHSYLNPSAPLKSSLDALRTGENNPGLIFSGKAKIDFPDQTAWEVWTAHDDKVFWSDPRFQQTKKIFLYTVIGLFVVITGLVYQSFKDSQLASKIEKFAYKLNTKSQVLTESSETLTNSTISLTKYIDSQTSAAHQTAASMNEIESMVAKTSENATQMSNLAKKGNDSCSKGRRALDEVLASIIIAQSQQITLESHMTQNEQDLNRILSLISQISSKTKLIDDIVFQTKLLSFNASVEAARAGESGKGFAVVADEVGSLAEMSGRSSKDILQTVVDGTSEVSKIIQNSSHIFREIIKDFSSAINRTSELAESCRQIFTQIQTDVSQIAEMTDQIAAANREQTQGISETNQAVQVISDSSRKSSDQTSEVKGVAQTLTDQAQEVESLVKNLSEIVGGENSSQGEAA